MHKSMMYDDFTGKENLEYSSDLYGITNKKENLENIVDRFQLIEILEQHFIKMQEILKMDSEIYL